MPLHYQTVYISFSINYMPIKKRLQALNLIIKLTQRDFFADSFQRLTKRVDNAFKRSYIARVINASRTFRKFPHHFLQFIFIKGVSHYDIRN